MMVQRTHQPFVFVGRRHSGDTRKETHTFGKRRVRGMNEQTVYSSRVGKNDLSITDAFLKSPIVFLLGAFTGCMALDVGQEPLKTWIDERAQEYNNDDPRLSARTLRRDTGEDTR